MKKKMTLAVFAVMLAATTVRAAERASDVSADAAGADASLFTLKGQFDKTKDAAQAPHDSITTVPTAAQVAAAQKAREEKIIALMRTSSTFPDEKVVKGPELSSREKIHMTYGAFMMGAHYYSTDWLIKTTGHICRVGTVGDSDDAYGDVQVEFVQCFKSPS